MKKKILLGALVGVMLYTTTSFAASYSYTDIKMSQASANGSNIYVPSGYVTMSGSNYSYSKNALWLELYEDLSGPDYKWFSTSMPIGGGVTGTNTYVGDSYYYYVHLDPQGPLYTNCEGWGQAKY